MKLVYQSAIEKLKNGEITTATKEHEKIKEYAERDKSGEVLPEAQGAEGKVGGSGDMPEVNKTESKDRETVEVEPEWGDAKLTYFN